jgi:hypothetical protein
VPITNNSGGPFSTTLTNAAENSVNLWRFNQFAIDGQVRNSTNGAKQEFNYNLGPFDFDPAITNANFDTNTVRGFRIVRTGNNFAFYVRRYDFGGTPEAWRPLTNFAFGTNLVRDDFEGVALQVGIAQSPFNAATRNL